MIRLNHAHFTVDDAGALRDFFVQHFEFKTATTRGQDAFVILDGADGFTLALMRSKSPDASVSPEQMHVGFFVDSVEAVHSKHEELRSANMEVGDVEEVSRAGFSSVTFYCRAPGGLLVEVSFHAT